MQLYYIRHGQSCNNALYRLTSSYSGRSEDPDLTELGIQQAKKLAEFIHDGKEAGYPGNPEPEAAGLGLTHLYTSLMVRAISTAQQIAQKTGLPLTAWRDLHEGGGIYQFHPETGEPVGLPGKPRWYFQERFPELALPDDLDETGWWNRPYEDRRERQARARRVLSELLQRHGGCKHRVALVSHGGFYNHFLSALLNLQDGGAQPSPEAVQAEIDENMILGTDATIWFSLSNAAITRIDFEPGDVRIRYQNRVDHLPAELIS
jgi:2,3-bisphosphoglycerate-dependent phosphoglycerate mutase